MSTKAWLFLAADLSCHIPQFCFSFLFNRSVLCILSVWTWILDCLARASSPAEFLPCPSYFSKLWTEPFTPSTPSHCENPFTLFILGNPAQAPASQWSFSGCLPLFLLNSITHSSTLYLAHAFIIIWFLLHNIYLSILEVRDQCSCHIPSNPHSP